MHLRKNLKIPGLILTRVKVLKTNNSGVVEVQMLKLK